MNYSPHRLEIEVGTYLSYCCNTLISHSTENQSHCNDDCDLYETLGHDVYQNIKEVINEYPSNLNIDDILVHSLILIVD